MSDKSAKLQAKLEAEVEKQINRFEGPSQTIEQIKARIAEVRKRFQLKAEERVKSLKKCENDKKS